MYCNIFREKEEDRITKLNARYPRLRFSKTLSSCICFNFEVIASYTSVKFMLAKWGQKNLHLAKFLKTYKLWTTLFLASGQKYMTSDQTRRRF